VRLAALILLTCAPASVQAHTFGQLYTLPVPLWLYGWAASAALVVSFLVAAYFLAADVGSAPAAPRERPQWLVWARRLHLGTVFRWLAVAMLVLTLVTALFGTRDPSRNFSMTAFWILFVLAFTYLTAVIGNVYAVINPWRVLAEGIGRFWPGYLRGRLRYPERLDVWPALALYFGFICFELFAWVRPPSLGAVLAGYTLLNLFAVWVIGVEAWFRHGELFSVLLRLVGVLAPLDVRREGGSVRLASRPIGAGMLQERPARLPTVLFVLFMLSSTAFDGLHATRVWFSLFWHDPTGIVTALAGDRPLAVFTAMRPWYLAWETLCLLLSPFLYFALYLGALALARTLAGSRRDLRELALDFAYTLLPIVFVYHFTHYYTLILANGLKILSLASDPFGWHWDLFGTREMFRAPIIPDLTITWHTQVGLIVLGHIASVVLAHRVALRVFPGRIRAAVSQVPMLVLMVAFTVAGLWILAQPLQATLVR
jgi:hypothetical protein